MNQSEMDQARFNMVEQQIRTWSVLDMKVLNLMQNTPRESFVPAKYKDLAYSDIALPLAHGQKMMHPKIEARMVQALTLASIDNILVIGAATGYVIALMAQLVHHVTAVEINPDLMKSAAANLKLQNFQNITLEEGDAVDGWPDHAPYQAIAVTGSVTKVSESLKQNLAVGGRMFVVIGQPSIMEAVLITRTSDTDWEQKSLFETSLPALENSEPPASFDF